MPDPAPVTINPDAPPANPAVVPPAVVPPAVVPPVQAPAAWHAGADPELVGHIQNLGWHDKTPQEAALAAAKAHREARAFIGVPEERLVRLPVTGDAASLAAYRAKIGAVTDPAKLDLTGVTLTGGKAVEPAFADLVRSTSVNLGLTPEQAQGVAKAFVGFTEAAGTADDAVSTAKLAEEKAKLATSWGANADAHLLTAKNAAGKIAAAAGMEPQEIVDAISALEGKVGYANVMRMFHAIGSKTGEDTFVGNGNSALNGGILTLEQASAKKAELMADKDWRGRYQAGGMQSKEYQEMHALNVIISGAS